MTIRNILIPGTGSTALRDSEGHKLGDPSRPDTAFGLAALLAGAGEDAVETLSMEHREGQWAPLRSSMREGRSILPDHVFTSLYERLPNDWTPFLYDWRADLRYNAERLVRWLTTRTREGERWHMVGHSQGTLIAVLASKMMDDEEAFSRYVARLRLVAPPLAGTIASAKWLLDRLSPGTETEFARTVVDRAREAIPLVPARSDGSDQASNLQEALRTWPALYQMLPVWDGIGEDRGRHGNLMRPEPWTGHDAIEAGLLARARETREWLDDPLSHLRGVDVSLLMTADEETPLSLETSGGMLTGTVARTGRGDTLVPYDATLDWFGGRLNEHVECVEGVGNTHTKLLNDAPVWERAKA